MTEPQLNEKFSSLPHPDPMDAEAVLAGAAHRRRQRNIVRASVGTMGVAALALITAIGLGALRPQEPEPAATPTHTVATPTPTTQSAPPTPSPSASRSSSTPTPTPSKSSPPSTAPTSSAPTTAVSSPGNKPPSNELFRKLRERADAPEGLKGFEQLFNCGEFVLGPGQNPPKSAIECLTQDNPPSQGASLSFSIPTSEGDPIVHFFIRRNAEKYVEQYESWHYDKYSDQAGETWLGDVCSIQSAKSKEGIFRCETKTILPKAQPMPADKGLAHDVLYLVDGNVGIRLNGERWTTWDLSVQSKIGEGVWTSQLSQSEWPTRTFTFASPDVMDGNTYFTTVIRGKFSNLKITDPSGAVVDTPSALELKPDFAMIYWHVATSKVPNNGPFTLAFTDANNRAVKVTLR